MCSLSILGGLMACLLAVPSFADEEPGQPSSRPGVTAPEPLPSPPGDPEAAAAEARSMIEKALERSAEANRSAGGESSEEKSVVIEPRADSPEPQPGSDLLVAKLSAQVAAGQLESKRLARKSPAEAFDRLDQLTALVEAESLPEEARLQILRRIERTRRELEEMTGKRRGELALERRNAAIEAEIEREQAMKTENEVRLAALVEQYNDLIDERRFDEAEAIAKKASELAPDNPVARQLLAQSRIIRRLAAQQSIADAQADAFLDVTEDVEMSAAGFVGPITFPDTKDWEELTKNRTRLAAEGRGRLTADEKEIQRKLSTKVEASHSGQPLAEVLEDLGKQAGVPIHIDAAGLEQEAVGTDTLVTLSIDQPISLKSALRLILDPLNLDFTIRDEVLKITSPRMVQGEFYSVTYPVADLVIPVPNFSSDGLGITGALREGYSRVNLRNSLSVQTGPMPAGITAAAGADSSISGVNLAQFQPLGGASSAAGSNPTVPFGAPSGGGAAADFNSLIQLIQQTVAPTTWNTVGGQGAIQPFETNLSLVVSQTQEVHEEIVDLLAQLRRLQDLQVTIEVRFISLNDTFFERIGVDFDFNIQSGVSEPLNMTAVPGQGGGSVYPQTLGLSARPGGPTQTIGLDSAGNPGVALSPLPSNQSPNYFSLPFRQNSFGAAGVPSLPGLPDPTTSAANFGFAILSDIEAYFLIQAAQGNTRSNVMQAPKVTLFNGQQAFVSDTRQRPFVTSVVPVVGDFAAAQQPVITVLSEGTAVNVQAVVSNDRRFVRLTLVPFFSQIGNVQEFTFEGERSTKSKSSDEKTGPDANGGNVGPIPLAAGLNFGSAQSSELEVSSNGTTIQQPEFLFTTVTTTVSVPDGGTVLLGGIKRLREGRNEFGVPILSKVPYINRLFKNVGLGRTTDSLMLMVTPRIIIQEEEEDKLLGVRTP
jgi:general secretion pathway protein D